MDEQRYANAMVSEQNTEPTYITKPSKTELQVLAVIRIRGMSI